MYEEKNENNSPIEHFLEKLDEVFKKEEEEKSIETIDFKELIIYQIEEQPKLIDLNRVLLYNPII